MDNEKHFISKPDDLSLSSRKNCDKAGMIVQDMVLSN
jgi:hypothetical protein